jgi:hypothetical protein
MYSYWIFYFATSIGLLIIRKNPDFVIRENPHLLETQNQNGNQFKVPLPLVGLYILAGLFILTFSFVVKSDNCQELESQKCKLQNLSPLFISYGFLFIALALYRWKVRNYFKSRPVQQ